MTAVRLFGCVDGSIVDGPGYRFSVFFQGCSRFCHGCHNPGSWAKDAGYVVSVDDVVDTIRHNPMIDGVTFTGGEPFDQPEALLEFCRALKGDYQLWAYTGYLLDELRESADPKVAEILSLLDVIVDGPYQETRRSLSTPWVGSTNQRVIKLHPDPWEA